jgi:hypothetical protein
MDLASYTAPKSVDLTLLKVGEKVTVTYIKTGSTTDVTGSRPSRSSRAGAAALLRGHKD